MPFGQFTLCRACVDLTACVAVCCLTLRIGGDMGALRAPLWQKKSSAVPPISKRSPLSDFRQTKKQRETGVKRVETVGVYPLAPRGERRNVPAVRRRRTPPLRFSENSPPVRDEHAPRSSLAPVSQCRKTSPQKTGMRPRFSRSEKVPQNE